MSVNLQHISSISELFTNIQLQHSLEWKNFNNVTMYCCDGTSHQNKLLVGLVFPMLARVEEFSMMTEVAVIIPDETVKGISVKIANFLGHCFEKNIESKDAIEINEENSRMRNSDAKFKETSENIKNDNENKEYEQIQNGASEIGYCIKSDEIDVSKPVNGEGKDFIKHLTKKEPNDNSEGNFIEAKSFRIKEEEDEVKIVDSQVEEQEEFLKRAKYITDNSECWEEDGKTLSRCTFCGREFSAANVSTHVSLYHCNIAYPCSFCDGFSGNRKNMKRHMASEHKKVFSSRKGKGGFCSLCNKDVTKMAAHIKRVHLQIKQHVCASCGKGFFDKSDIERHYVDAHSETKEMCPKCGLYFKKVAAHIKKVHSNEKKQDACPVCGKMVGDVKDHIRSVHEKVKNFSCTFCPLQTYKLNTLKRHLMAHEKYSSQNKPYEYKKPPQYNWENMEKATELVSTGKMSRRKASKLFNLSVHEIKKACLKAPL